MEISFAKCESILNTLPIGYYAGRRVQTSLEEDVQYSCYSPMEDKIIISYPQLNKALEKMPEGGDVESRVRAMIYHEVSHAILTPEYIIKWCSGDEEQLNVINIFEDERIESVLRNYYLNVDFRQQIYDICGGPKEPQDSIGAFFNAVRFGVAPEHYLKEINELIQQYSNMHRNSDDHTAYHYVWDVWTLYKRMRSDFKTNPENYKPQNASGEGQGATQPNDLKGSPQDTENNGDGQPQMGQFGEGSESDEQKNTMAQIIGDADRELQKELKDIQNMFASGFDIESRLKQGQREQLHELQKTAETIIGNFNKKNSGGSGVNAYSGVFNPRAVVRKDYRYFERAMAIQGNNKFGTCHLNLFIDCSGSFQPSEALINGVLTVLSEIERKNRNFSLDVVFCGEGVYKCKNVRERNIKCSGGNDLPDDMKDVFMKLQKQNTYNYNIVLFDGDAFSDYWANDKKSRCTRVFSTFDYKATTLITDSDNTKYMGRDGFHTAKVVVTDQYTDELIQHITKALTIAFG